MDGKNSSKNILKLFEQSNTYITIEKLQTTIEFNLLDWYS